MINTNILALFCYECLEFNLTFFRTTTKKKDCAINTRD